MRKCDVTLREVEQDFCNGDAYASGHPRRGFTTISEKLDAQAEQIVERRRGNVRVRSYNRAIDFVFELLSGRRIKRAVESITSTPFMLLISNATITPLADRRDCWATLRSECRSFPGGQRRSNKPIKWRH